VTEKAGTDPGKGREKDKARPEPDESKELAAPPADKMMRRPGKSK